MSDKPIALPEEVAKYMEYPFAWHFGNIKVVLETMECTGELPHGCPNCRGLDFCTKRDALKRYATMEKCWEALCSSIPRAQIEAMESEMRHLSEVIVSANTEAYKDTLNTFANRLLALLHPELKGEDKP